MLNKDSQDIYQSTRYRKFIYLNALQNDKENPEIELSNENRIVVNLDNKQDENLKDQIDIENDQIDIDKIEAKGKEKSSKDKNVGFKDEKYTSNEKIKRKKVLQTISQELEKNLKNHINKDKRLNSDERGPSFVESCHE